MVPPRSGAQALQVYERYRPPLPAGAARVSRRLPDLSPLVDAYDVFLFDAFGVLNIGDSPIDGAAACLHALRAAGKSVLIVSNAAAFPASHWLAKYRAMGFAADGICSRDVLCRHWQRQPPGRYVGLMAPADAPLEDLPQAHERLADDATLYDAVDAFVLLGSADWTSQRQSLMLASLQRRPRPVWVGNPDLVAPREFGWSLEPGWYACALTHQLPHLPVRYFGKPYGEIFACALQRVNYAGPRHRVLMCGDTLHTDILGAQAAGLHSAWVVGNLDIDIDTAPASAQIWPDYIVPRIGWQ